MLHVTVVILIAQHAEESTKLHNHLRSWKICDCFYLVRQRFDAVAVNLVPEKFCCVDQKRTWLG